VLTHSSTGIRGWITGTKTANVAAIVSYEPGNAVFPEGEVPPPIRRVDGMMVPAGEVIPMADFMKLTKFPIQIVWGDYIPARPIRSTSARGSRSTRAVSMSSARS
jgi:hypothetical protein